MRRVLLAAALVLSAACSAPAEEDRELVVLAAASLTEVLPEVGRLYEREHPGSTVSFSFAGSQTLVAQVAQGVPADVLVTADERSIDAVRSELARPPVVAARNRLALVTEPGNPLGIRGLSDLARPDVVLVLAAPEVPAGRAAATALADAGVAAVPRSLEPDVKAVVQKVRLGEADAGIAYVTDVRAADGTVEGIPLPGTAGAYAVAALRGSEPAAQDLVDLLLSPRGREVLERAGFLPP